jgi:hypothetical protein
MFCLLSVFLCCLCIHVTEYEQMGGGGAAKFSLAQGRKIPKYGPGRSQSYDFMIFICS